jgi:hypothetical protein
MKNPRTIAIVCIIVAVVIAIGSGAIFFLSTKSNPSPSPSGTPGAISNPNFKGIMIFSGKNSSAHSDDPNVVGTNLNYYWSQLEPQKGQYQWDVIDKDMQPWVSNNKVVSIRIATSGWKAWGPPYSQKGTPQWVYDQGVQSVTEDDNAIKPEYWNPIFQQNLKNFVQAFASKYDGNPHVAFIEIGVGDGGETKVDTHNNNGSSQTQKRLQLWTAIGYSDQAWWGAIQQILDTYSTAFHSTPLVVMPDSTFIGNDKSFSESLVVNYAVSHHLWLQDNGLIPNRTLKGPWTQTSVIAEQRASTSADHNSLQGELTAAMNLHAVYVMVFLSDIDDSTNQPVLQQFAAQAHK